jgi:hypothetical protein
MPINFVQQHREHRYNLFKGLYLQFLKSERKFVNWMLVSTDLGLERVTAREHLKYFGDKGFVVRTSGPNTILTIKGISEFKSRHEALRRNEDEQQLELQNDPSQQHARAQQIMNFDTPLGEAALDEASGLPKANSQRGTGPLEPTRQGPEKAVDLEELSALVAAVRKALQAAEMPAVEKADVEADLKTIEAQAEKSKPTTQTILAHFTTIGYVLEGYGDDTGLAEVQAQIVGFLTQHPAIARVF